MSVVDRENWVEVDGFPDYSVNPLGHVRNNFTKRRLFPRFNQYDVPYVGLMRNGRQCIRSLPRIVAQAFLPQPNPIFDTPIQKDGDPNNCSADNLEWRPRWYAVYYKNQFKDPYENPINVRIRVVGERKTYRSSLEAAQAFGLLEREVVLSILNHTPAWPTYQQFEVA